MEKHLKNSAEELLSVGREHVATRDKHPADVDQPAERAKKLGEQAAQTNVHPSSNAKRPSMEEAYNMKHFKDYKE